MISFVDHGFGVEPKGIPRPKFFSCCLLGVWDTYNFNLTCGCCPIQLVSDNALGILSSYSLGRVNILQPSLPYLAETAI